LRDTVNAHSLQPDGSYIPILPAPDEEPFDSQDWFITHPLIEEADEDEIQETTTISAIPSRA
jgi:polyphosphate kinase